MSSRTWPLAAVVAVSVLMLIAGILYEPARVESSTEEPPEAPSAAPPPPPAPAPVRAAAPGGPPGAAAGAPTASPPPPPASAPVQAQPGSAPVVDRAALPLPFPEGAPPERTVRGFPDVVARVARECGMPLEPLRTDCSEYPCIAWARATGPSPRGFGLGECRPWTEAFPERNVLVEFERLLPDGRREPVFAFFAVPPQPEEDDIAERRARARLLRVRDELGLQGDVLP